jgi:hypothetical protein
LIYPKKISTPKTKNIIPMLPDLQSLKWICHALFEFVFKTFFQKELFFKLHPSEAGGDLGVDLSVDLGGEMGGGGGGVKWGVIWGQF